MSDLMRLIPFDKMMEWVLAEYKNEGTIFGVSKNKFFKKANTNNLKLFGDVLENRLGPAAGPNTQLAQNIVASYVAGSRFFELKTVQTLDGEDLPVSKPCILAKDECYNVEWSTELIVPDAFNEYVKAWFALNILAKEFSLGSNNGFIFNMSVGYDLEGIKSEKINNFIEGLKDASETPVWKECKEFVLNNLGMFKNIDKDFVEGISPKVCGSITLSTLHGCPPAEIERIARYLLEEKKLHTYVKCNPTLLGYEFARNILDKMGYDYIAFDDHHFKNDLQFSDAVPMITRLKALAKDVGLTFGVKLTNTFPVKIKNNELPGEEMYMSGRSLYPLTINLAYKLAKEFNGDLRISYSGGADFFNIDKIYKTGIWPITLATTILKPGGYLRLKQMADLLESVDHASEFNGVNVGELKALAETVVTDINHLKEHKEVENRKIDKTVPLADCFIAPCTNGCPINQDIPEYVRLVGEGRYLEALEVITAKNPLPFITGTLCNHKCMTKCTRLDYDESVGIRSAKLVAAQNAFSELMSKLDTPVLDSDFKVAVIGGGPAGLAAAYFLGQNGVKVTIFEKKDEIGGVMQHVAPGFRISKEAINNDMALIRKMGVDIRLGVDGNFSVEQLKKEGYKYIFVAIGAWKPGFLKLDSCDSKILNVLEFLEDYNKAQDTLKIGKNVAVIGAGNSAMDAARSAKRVAGVENVYIVYRRTKKYMPADREEIHLAVEDGVEFRELLAPVSYTNGILKCQKMELGAPDASGRRSPVAVAGEFVDLQVDSIIAAVGEQVEAELLVNNGIEVDARGRIKVNPETNETSVANVFIGGDALRGPATIVEGIADGTKFANVILAKEKNQTLNLEREVNFDEEKQINEINDKKGVLKNTCAPEQESSRCLECHQVCNICVEVCPNRANFAVRVQTDNVKCKNQVIHIDGMCNECGNCEAFCPYDSAPYKDKFTFYWSVEDFDDSENAGFVLVDKASNQFRVRLGDKTADAAFDELGKTNGEIPAEIADIIWTVYRDYGYLFV
jgi:putative selenate reductase